MLNNFRNQNYKSIIKKQKRKKLDEKVFLAKFKYYITQDKIVLTNNVLKEYDDVKENIKVLIINKYFWYSQKSKQHKMFNVYKNNNFKIKLEINGKINL